MNKNDKKNAFLKRAIKLQCYKKNRAMHNSPITRKNAPIFNIPNKTLISYDIDRRLLKRRGL